MVLQGNHHVFVDVKYLDMAVIHSLETGLEIDVTMLHLEENHQPFAIVKTFEPGGHTITGPSTIRISR